MFELAFPAAPLPLAHVAGSTKRFPVRRVYCIGRNYVEHAREMGFEPDPSSLFFFLKPADAIVGAHDDVPYPPGTRNLQHEIELVVAIGKRGAHIDADGALDHIWGYAVGNDLTRRDLQLAARDKGRPWEIGKSFDRSAVLGAIHPVSMLGHLPDDASIWLEVNGVRRQDAKIADMIFPVATLIARLSTLYELMPGDLIFTGTPAGVGSVLPGDVITGGIDGLDVLRTRIVPTQS